MYRVCATVFLTLLLAESNVEPINVAVPFEFVDETQVKAIELYFLVVLLVFDKFAK